MVISPNASPAVIGTSPNPKTNHSPHTIAWRKYTMKNPKNGSIQKAGGWLWTAGFMSVHTKLEVMESMHQWTHTYA